MSSPQVGTAHCTHDRHCPNMYKCVYTQGDKWGGMGTCECTHTHAAEHSRRQSCTHVRFLALARSLSLSLSLSLSHAHAHTHTLTHASPTLKYFDRMIIILKYIFLTKFTYNTASMYITIAIHTSTIQCTFNKLLVCYNVNSIFSLAAGGNNCIVNATIISGHKEYLNYS